MPTTIDVSTPIILLKSDLHGPLAVTRSLGRLGIPVYIAGAHRRTPSSWSRFCRGTFDLDIEQAPARDSVKYLERIARWLGRRAILVATSDNAALFIAANAAALRNSFIFPDVTSHVVQSVYSKKEMYLLARSMGVPTPHTFFPTSKQEAANFANEAAFPIIVKAVEDRQARNKDARTKAIVRDPRELLASYEIMQDSDQPNVMFQEFIPGGEDANWMFNGYFNAESDCLFGLTGKKLRQYRPYAGITSLGVCLPNPAVAETTISLMKTIGYRGALDIGFRFDARDGQYKVFDINPRIGCTFRLFVSDTGMDVARALYLDLTGQKIAAGNAIHGRKWIVEDLDLASSFRYWRDGKLSAKEWARSFAGIQEGAFFALDDPGPIVSQAWNDLREIFPRSEKQTAKTGSLQSSLTR